MYVPEELSVLSKCPNGRAIPTVVCDPATSLIMGVYFQSSKT